jgi:hypothetical protein
MKGGVKRTNLGSEDMIEFEVNVERRSANGSGVVW